MFLLFTGVVVAFLLSLVLWPWYFLFSRIYESLETRKVLFNFIYSSKLSSTFIQFLWINEQITELVRIIRNGEETIDEVILRALQYYVRNLLFSSSGM